MTQRRASWGEVLRALGEAFVEVLRAEMALLAEQWKEAGMLVGIAVALGGAVFFSMFWLCGLLVLAGVDLVRRLTEWQLWQASLLVAGLLSLIMLVALGVAWLLVRRLKSPVAAFGERVNDHVAWWQDQILEGEPRLAESQPSEQPPSEQPSKSGDERRPS